MMTSETSAGDTKMKRALKNWKTSLAGLFGIAGVIIPVVAPQHAATIQQATALAISLGLIVAKDADKTGL
jgi:hypothetical protein